MIEMKDSERIQWAEWGGKPPWLDLESGAVLYEAADGTRYYLPPTLLRRLLLAVRRWFK